VIGFILVGALYLLSLVALYFVLRPGRPRMDEPSFERLPIRDVLVVRGWEDESVDAFGAFAQMMGKPVIVLHGSQDVESYTAEEVARLFHEAYERLAPEHGYRTREASAKSWDEVPEDNRKLMIATAAEVLRQLGHPISRLLRPEDRW
jgi:hypothetical protein